MGFCKARANINGINQCINEGKLTALAMDPIEKKPFRHFYPGSQILSCGSFGCNLACPFCQNYMISISNSHTAHYHDVSIHQLVEKILSFPMNLGIAFTYNEPLLSYEYIIAVAEKIKAYGKKVVLVTNGTAEISILEKLVPYIDAMNIDLKGDSQFYQELSGNYDSVKASIAYVYDKCHLEVTTLVIPGKNDSTSWIASEAAWLASLDQNIVLHLSRYFPRYHYSIPATDPNRIFAMKEAAEKYLNHVYTGNIW